MKNTCFIHVATLGNYQNIIDNIFNLFEEVNLYNDICKIYVNIAGDKKVLLPKNNKIETIPIRAALSDFEFSTLNLIKKYTEQEISNILYLHTKGASTPENICINEWRDYMLYFNVLRYKQALKLLETNDAVGVDLVDNPAKHFSGNIWWSTTQHIKNLPDPKKLPIILSERHKCEFWICSDKTRKYTSMHNSNIDVYSRHLTRYPKTYYENIN